MRSPNKFIALTSPEISHDGQNLAVIVDMEAAQLDLEIPLQEIGAIIQFLAEAAARSNHQQHSPHPLSPIPVTGLAFSPGKNANQTLLVVRLGSTDLAFALDSNAVALLGRDFARTAQVLSAHSPNPH